MKKTNKRILTVIMCAMLSGSALTSCASQNATDSTSDGIRGEELHTYGQSSETEKSPTAGNTQSPSYENIESGKDNGSHDIQADTYKAQISYYMSLTETLQAELLKIKEENYIDACEYQLKIDALEETIDELNDALQSLKKNESSDASTNTQAPPNENLSARSDFKYTVTGGEITLTQYVGKAIDVVIPATIDGYPVVKIGEEAFKEKTVRSVIIPSGVKEIDWFAFSGCTTLETVTIPASVMSVKYGAFDYCPKTLTVKCPKGSYIEAYAKSFGIKTQAE